jgi:SnoaL-like protein
MPNGSDLQRLIDERDIRDCVQRYCHGTDRQDWQLVVDCYVPGAFDDHGSYAGPIEGLATWLSERSGRRGAKQHYIANQLVEIAGDTAVCESYYFCYIEFIGDPEFAGTDEPSAVVMGGRYVDRMRRIAVGWRIAERSVVVDWSRDLGRPTSWSAPAAAHFTAGRNDGTDPAQLAFAELRAAAR